MKSILFLLTLAFVAEGRGQDFPPLPQETEAEAEFHGYSEYVETLERLRLKPLELKRIKPTELLVLPGVTPRLAADIVDYARHNDPYSIKEIADSLGLSPELELILTYCASISAEPRRSWGFDFRSREYSAFAQARGYAEGVYRGSPLESCQRLNAAAGEFELSASWAKDAGEPIDRASASGGISWRSENISLACGDYSLAAGLGTLLGRAFPPVKSGETIAPAIASFSETKPNTSSYFSKKLRGGAAEYITDDRDFSLKFFYSDQSRAGTYDSAKRAITSLYSSGLYRSDGEAAKRGAVRERIIGACGEASFGPLNLGGTGYIIDYNKDISTESKANFSGSQGALASLYAELALKKASLAAEATRDAKNNYSAVVAAETALGKLELAARARYFPGDFRSPLGSSFGESSTPSNEGGLYLGARFPLSDSVKFSAYADLFATPERTYYVSKPVRGADLLTQFDFKLKNYASLSLRGRFETQNDEAEIGRERVGFRKYKYSFRADARKALRGICDVRALTDFRQVDFQGALPAQFGVAAYIELSKKIGNWFEASARATIFSTDGYESAVWQYESLLPGYFSVPALYERGSRFSARLRVSPFDGLNITAAYSGSAKNYRESLGSGWDETASNVARTFYLQLDARY